MTTKTRTPADALTDAREAHAAADALDAKADAARAAAARIAADNMDAIVKNPDEAVRVFGVLAKMDHLRGRDRAGLSEGLAWAWGETTAIRPFRE